MDRDPKAGEPNAGWALAASVLVGALCAALSLSSPLRASGADTVPGRLGAAVFACHGSLDLREVDWLAAADARGALPYYVGRGDRDGAVISVFGPGAALLGGPFMEGLEPGTGVPDLELERRARDAATAAVAASAALLCAALTRRFRAPVAALAALGAALSFAGVPTLAQGLWVQTAVLVPLVGSLVALSFPEALGGALFASAPGLLGACALMRPNTAFLAAAIGLVWLRGLLARPRRVRLGVASALLAALFWLPLFAWNQAHTGDPLALRLYFASHETGRLADATSLGSLLRGLAGLAVSPARGLVFYAPAMLVAIYLGLRRGGRDTRILTAGVLVHIAVIAAYRQWWGGWVFGPRMLAEAAWVCPLLVARVPAAKVDRAALIAALAWTLGVGCLGTYRFGLGRWDLRRDPDHHKEALWDFADSPLTAMLAGRGTGARDAPPGPYLYCAEGAPALVTLPSDVGPRAP